MTTDWSRYDFCPRCWVKVGQPCVDVRNGKPIGGIHHKRRVSDDHRYQRTK